MHSYPASGEVAAAVDAGAIYGSEFQPGACRIDPLVMGRERDRRDRSGNLFVLAGCSIPEHLVDYV